jgi:hypothetical protein
MEHADCSRRLAVKRSPAVEPTDATQPTTTLGIVKMTESLH